MNAPVIVVAAGTGSRLGGTTHKALVSLAGEPLVIHTLRRLMESPLCGPFVVVGHADDLERLTELCALLPGDVTVTPGGARRQDSVAAGLAALGAADALPPDAIVMIHDAARPFVPVAALPALAEAAGRHGAAVLAVPVTDTLKRARDDAPDLVASTVSREGLWSVQTPQAFGASTLRDLLMTADAEQRSVTDEATLFEESGRAVAFVEGSPLNFKITTPPDLELARILLDESRRKAQA